MTADNRIWIGQDGQRYGPYSEDEIRQWLQEGRVTMHTLAWREGMPDWAPLSSFFAADAAASPPPLPAGMPPLMSAPAPMAGNARAPFGDAARATLPEPPSLHWGLVFLFSLLTLGLFGIYWAFHQASWVRRIDPRSNGMLLLGISLACFVIGEPLYFIGIFAGMHDGQAGNLQLVSLAGTLLFARWVLYLAAYFSMGDSVKKALAARGVSLHIGGPTLFFFPMFFMQANLSWVARWKRSGQTSPKPSKAIFWIVFLLLPFALGILLGFAIAAYQQHASRADLGEVRSPAAALHDARPILAHALVGVVPGESSKR